MPEIGPVTTGLIIMAAVLVLGIGSAALGMALADLFSAWRARKNLDRCVRAARDQAEKLRK